MTVTRTDTPIDRSAGHVLLDRTRALIEPVLRSAVGSLAHPFDHMAGYHFGWWDAAGEPAGADGGKMLRPALALGAAITCGADPGIAAGAAAAAELLHNFSLIHDDIVDGDRLRRGRPTVWSIWGITDAILLGDALHASAFEVLTTQMPKTIAAHASSRLSSTTLELCRGQWHDCNFETRDHVDVDEYISMVGGKTGALLGFSCAIGAVCAGADKDTVAALDTFGRELGLAFQFVDDVLGIWGDPAVTGKPVGSDLAHRKWTLPVVVALEVGAAELAGLYRSGLPLDAAQVETATRLIEQADGRRIALRHARNRIETALNALPADADGSALRALAQLVALRDR